MPRDLLEDPGVIARPRGPGQLRDLLEGFDTPHEKPQNHLGGRDLFEAFDVAPPEASKVDTGINLSGDIEREADRQDAMRPEPQAAPPTLESGLQVREAPMQEPATTFPQPTRNDTMGDLGTQAGMPARPPIPRAPETPGPLALPPAPPPTQRAPVPPSPDRTAIEDMIAGAERDADILAPEVGVTADRLPRTEDFGRSLDPVELARSGAKLSPGHFLRRPSASQTTPEVIVPPIERRGAPVDEKTYLAIKSAYEAATPEQRAQMVARPDWRGSVAKAIDNQYRELDAAMARAPALDVADSRVEARARRYGLQGADPGVAANMASAEMEFGAPEQPAASAQASTFDFETAQDMKADGSTTQMIRRGAYLGRKTLKQQVLGLHQVIGDLVGADDYAAVMGKAHAQTQQEIEAAGEAKTAFERNFEGAIASLISQSPGLAIAIGTGAQAVPLAMMGAQVFGQEYATGREAGLDQGQAMVRASIQGAAEIIGERFSLGATTKAMREGIRRAVDAVRQAPVDASRETLSNLFLKSLARENVGEQLTTAIQFWSDTAPEIGLTPDATPEQYLTAVADTLVQTTIQSGIMAGAGMGPAAIGGLVNDRGDSAALATARAESARDKALAQWRQAFRQDTPREPGAMRATIEPIADRAEPVMGTAPVQDFRPEPVMGEPVAAQDSAPEPVATGIYAEPVPGTDAAGQFDASLGEANNSPRNEPSLPDLRGDPQSRQSHALDAGAVDLLAGSESVGARPPDRDAGARTSADRDNRSPDSPDPSVTPRAPALGIPVEGRAARMSTDVLNEPDSAERSDLGVAAGEAPAGLTTWRDRLSVMDDEALDRELQTARTHNDVVEIEAIRRYHGESQAKEFSGWNRRKKDAWINSELRTPAQDYMNARQLPEMLIEEYRDAANDFDTESPAELGRSVALSVRDIDKPGFFQSPEGMRFRNAMQYAREQGWEMDDVLAGMRSRGVEWAGADAQELFGRLFKSAPGANTATGIGLAVPAERPAVSAPIDSAAHEAASSPKNALPEPTDAQREASNFKMGHADVAGLGITIQYPAGSERSGRSAKGQEWRRTMRAHYGHITGVPARAPDKEHVDVYVKPGAAQDFDGDVFIVNQVRPDTGRYDEPKTMLGYDTEAEARQAYLAHYPDDWRGLRSIVRVPMERFQAMLQDPDAFKQAVRPGETRAELAATGRDVGARVRVVEGPTKIQGQVGTLLSKGRIKLDTGEVQPHAISARFEKLEEPKVSVDVRSKAYTEKTAALKARSLTKAGTPSAVTPHPDTAGKFAVVPAIETPPQPSSNERAVLGMPAPASRDYIAPAAGSDRKVATDRARPDAIRRVITRLLNVPINERRFNVRKALGIFKVKPQTIRVRNRNDIDTIAHEVGHHFSETNKEVRKEMIRHKDELLALTPSVYAKEPVRLRIEEGFAEFVRLHLTDPDIAKSSAPEFHAAFDRFIIDNAYQPIFDDLRTMIDDWHRLDPAERIMAKVGNARKSTLDRLEETFGKDRLIFEVLDNWLPLRRMVEDLAPDIEASKDPFKAAHLLAGDAAIIEDWIVNATVPFDYAKRAEPKNYGKPLHQILKPVAKDLRRFTAYVIAKRADELKAMGKERLYTAAEIKAGLTLETPAFEAAAKELYAYSDRLVDYAVEGGLLAPEAAAKFREYTSYVPFTRERDDTEGGSRRGSPFKRLIGGTANLRDPVSNIIENTAAIIHATNRNAVLLKALELAKTVPGGARWIEEVPIPQQAVQLATQRILDEFTRQGAKIDPEAAKDLTAIQTFFKPNLLGNKSERIVLIKDQGEPKALQINSLMLWQALEAFEPLDLGLVGEMLAVPSDLLRAGVTLSPDFMSRNFARDTLSGFMQSQHNMLPVLDTVGGFKEVATRSDMAKLYRAFGGAYADLWKGDSEQTRKVLERMAKRGRFDPRTILTPAGIIRVLHSIGSISEAGTRVAEFKKTTRDGDIDSLIDAAYNAREVSVDFGMHGHNRTVRFLTRITPFLNPALQGFYKMGRTGQERFLTTLLRGSALTMFSVALFLMNRDEDWYDEIEAWEKDMYFHMDIGLREGDGRVIPFRIPKPFEWGAAFGSVPEAITAFAIDRGGKEMADRLLSILEHAFGLRTVPTAVLVPAELWANKSTFTDRPIVSEAKEGLDPELQYGPGTSQTARAIGAGVGVSPAKIDHVIRGFLGTMGVYAVGLADQGVRYLGDIPTGPKVQYTELPVIKAFVRDPGSPNSRHVTEFYELLQKANQASGSHRKYDGDEADLYYAEHQAAIDMAPDARRMARELAELRRQNEEIKDDREYSAEEKLRLMSANNVEIKKLAKEFVTERARGRRDSKEAGQRASAR